MTDMDVDIDYGMDEDTARMLAEAEAMQAVRPTREPKQRATQLTTPNRQMASTSRR